MSSLFGQNIKISIFGQSHSKAIGVTIDGLPAGKKIDMEKLFSFMQRRAPGTSEFSTSRREEDKPHFLCGLIDDITCGAPLTAIILNNNVKSKDYEKIADLPRPSHADYTAHIKYKGFNDIRGGGHFSGRLTAPLCLVGGIIMQLLEEEGIEVFSHIKQIYNIKDDAFNSVNPDIALYKSASQNKFSVLNKDAENKMKNAIIKAKTEGNSLGGIIECMVTGLPVGVGEPMFEGIENKIAQAVFAVPAVKGIEFGNGFDSVLLTGKENNDEFYTKNDEIKTMTNNSGGINGGISNGMPIIFRIAIKPTPSIQIKQNTINLSKNENSQLQIVGRHDPCIVPRALPCIESAAAIAIYDLLLNLK